MPAIFLQSSRASTYSWESGNTQLYYTVFTAYDCATKIAWEKL